MPWFYVDDGFSDSKPVTHLPTRHRLAACGLWVLAGSWAAKEETDGFVPDSRLKLLGARDSLIDALTTPGPSSRPLWTKVDAGVQFESWSKWQRTRDELLQKRLADAERQRNSRSRRRKGRDALTGDDAGMSHCDNDSQANESAEAVTGGVTRDLARACADPTRPDPLLVVGEGCAVGEPDGLPPRFCVDHPSGTNRGCGPCREARIRREDAEAELARDELDAKRRQREAAANCPTCHGTNWIPDTEPAVKCHHHQEATHA